MKCQCGCERDTLRNNKFVNGHNSRLLAKPRLPVAHGSIDGKLVAYIPLTQGQYTIVDEFNFGRVNAFRWCAVWSPHDKKFRAQRRRGNSTVFLHRFILGLTPENDAFVDHDNGNPLDNRECNIRLANRSQNAQNSAWRSDNSSGYRGVWWHKQRQKWVAELRVKGKRVFLGYFHDPRKASDAYQAGIKVHFGEFARPA